MAFGEIFAGPSSYGEALPSHDLSMALQAISHMDSLATIHAEEVGPLQPETMDAHDSNRTPQGEAEAVRKVCNLNVSGCRLHFCHMSSARAIEVVLEQRRLLNGIPRDKLIIPGVSGHLSK